MNDEKTEIVRQYGAFLQLKSAMNKLKSAAAALAAALSALGTSLEPFSCRHCRHRPPSGEGDYDGGCPMWDNGDDGWGAHWNGDDAGFCYMWEAAE